MRAQQVGSMAHRLVVVVVLLLLLPTVQWIQELHSMVLLKPPP